MKIFVVLKSIAKKSKVLRIFIRNIMYGIEKINYKLIGLTVKEDEKSIVFGAYNGKSYACSPKAVYEYMLKDDFFSDYKFVWLFENPDDHLDLQNNKNTVLVKNRTKLCKKYLHTARYIILNYRAPDYWTPAKKQVYIQCWHGTPLKRLGYDILTSDNAMNSIEEIQKKYKTDALRINYLLSSCKFTTEKFATAWNLENFNKKDALIEIGYPRNDILSKYTQEQVEKIKVKLGLLNSEKKIILYAPTWRDNQYDASKGYVYSNPVDFDLLNKKLSDDYIILFRAHYMVANHFDFKQYEGFIYDVSDYDDINELYIISDYLITDYSSVFFDYAILERPIFFYMYDMDEYANEMRGFYIDVNELPGPIVKTETELIKAIKANSKDNYKEMLREFNCKYNEKNDGKAAERLADIIKSMK